MWPSDLFVCTAILEGGPALGKEELVGRLLTLLYQAGHLAAADLPGVRDAVLRRERLGSTSLGRGLAVPHEAAAQAALLRDIAGNPFRPLRVDPLWLAWNAGTVVRLAEGIYEEQAFDRLPILADALVEAGCDDEDVLGHCRSAGPHARGCHVLDLLLGKR
jgi:mannitol/fructose-specific phosphotransferase system IIA component